MGGFFSAPKLPDPPPLPVIEDPSDKEREERLAALERQRRGRSSLIRTSARGLLSEQADGGPDGGSDGPKTLLGE